MCVCCISWGVGGVFRKYNFGQKQKIYTIKTGHIINSKSISERLEIK